MDFRGQLHVSAALPPERTPKPTEDESELVPAVVRMVLKNRKYSYQQSNPVPFRHTEISRCLSSL